jgi:hypothetical protein
VTPEQLHQNALNMKARQCLYAAALWLRATANVQYPITGTSPEEDRQAAEDDTQRAKESGLAVLDLCNDGYEQIVSTEYAEGTVTLTLKAERPAGWKRKETPLEKKVFYPTVPILVELTPDEARRDGWRIEEQFDMNSRRSNWRIYDPVGRMVMDWRLAHLSNVEDEEAAWKALARGERNG